MPIATTHYSFKTRYNFNFISSSKIFILFFLSCISFFRASGSRDFAKEKSMLKNMKSKHTTTLCKLRKLEPILNNIEKKRTFETDDRDMKSLALLIYKLKATCLKKADLNLLFGLEAKFGSYLENKNENINNLETEPNSLNGLRSKMILFISDVLKKRDEFKEGKHSEYRENINNKLKILGYGTVPNIFNKYFFNKYSDNSIGNTQNEITFFERKQLWNIMRDSDTTWDTICESDASGKLGAYYGMNKFSTLLSKVFPRNEDDYVYMKILNKKIFLDNHINGLTSDNVLKNKIEKLKKMYEAILLHKHSSESEQKNKPLIVTTIDDTERETKEDEGSPIVSKENFSTEKYKKMSLINKEIESTVKKVKDPIEDLIMGGVDSFTKYYSIKVEKYSFFWLAKKEKNGYNIELRGIDKKNNLNGKGYNFSDFLNNELEKLKNKRACIYLSSLGYKIPKSNGKTLETKSKNKKIIESQPPILKNNKTSPLGDESPFGAENKDESHEIDSLEKRKTDIFEKKSRIERIRSMRESIQLNLDSDLSRAIDKSLKSKEENTDAELKTDSDADATNSANETNLEHLQKQKAEKKEEIQRKKKPWEWKIYLRGKKALASLARAKGEWIVKEGYIVFSPEDDNKRNRRNKKKQKKNSICILECDCELVKVVKNKNKKESKVKLKIKNGKLVKELSKDSFLYKSKKKNKITIEAYQKDGEKIVEGSKKQFDIDSITEKFTINIIGKVGMAGINFHLNSEVYKAGHSTSKDNINYTSYKSLKLFEKMIGSDLCRLEVEYNSLKKEIMLEIDEEIEKIPEDFREKEQNFGKKNLGFLINSNETNRYTNLVAKMMEIKSEEIDISSLDFLAGDKKMTEIDSKIHGLILSDTNISQKSFLEESKKEYDKEKKKEDEEWSKIESIAIKHYQSKDEAQVAFKKQIEESNNLTYPVRDIRKDLSETGDSTKTLCIELDSISKKVELISNNMKNKPVSDRERAREPSRNGNRRYYDKKPVLQDVANILNKIKNKWANQFISFSGNTKLFNGINISSCDHNFSEDGKKDDIFDQIECDRSDPKYLYKTFSSNSFRGSQSPPFLKKDTLSHRIYSLFETIFSSKEFRFFVKIFTTFFASICFYDFYLVFTGESKNKRKRKRKRKRKKVTYMYMVGKSLYKTCSRITSPYPYPKKSKKVKIKKKKRRKKINRK